MDLLGSVAASGASTTASSKKRGRSGSSSKTSQPFALADWTKCCGHSLRSGMMRNGIVYPLAPLAHLTGEIESGLWPTPKASDTHAENPQTKQARNERLRAAGKPKGCGSPSLATRIEYGMTHLWPTPTRQDACGRDRHNQRNGGVILSLLGEARKWPTPTTRDYKDGSAQSCKNVPVNGLLGRAVHWPTPRAQSARGSGPSRTGHKTDLQTQAGGSLNPTWVEWLMGFPLGWTALAPSATPSSRKSRKSSDER